MRAYTGNQWQDNALGSVGSFNPAAVSTGPYCALSAGSAPVIFGVTPQPYASRLVFISTTFYIYANTGVTGGTIQPQIQLADGVYRDYGSLITVAAAGFVLAITIITQILGAQFNITSGITGGSLFLEIDCLLGG